MCVCVCVCVRVCMCVGNLDKLRRDFSGLRTEFVTYVQSEIHSSDRRNVIHKLTGVDENAVTASTHLLTLKRAVEDQIIAIAEASRQQSERLAESFTRISAMQDTLMLRLSQVL
jgi:ribosomal protein S20